MDLLNSVKSWLNEKPVEENDSQNDGVQNILEKTNDTDKIEGSKPAKVEKEEMTVDQSESSVEKSSVKQDENFESTEDLVDLEKIAKDLGSFVFSFTKKATKTAVDTATKVKSVVEDTSIIGDFKREQDKFVAEKHQKHPGAAVPPWVGYNEEEDMKQKILALSEDQRNFLRNPPSGVQFKFDFDLTYPIALATLAEDDNLKQMRFELVPKKIKEEDFWKNYFYRVSLITNSSQLSSLTSSKADDSGKDELSEDEQKRRSEPPRDPTAGGRVPRQDSLGGEAAAGGATEFASEDFSGEVSQEELRQGMAQLGMDKNLKAEGGKDKSLDKSPSNKDPKSGAKAASPKVGASGGEEPGTVSEEAEWERELQKELQDYEMVEGDKDEEDKDLENQIEQMLELEGDE